MLKLSNVLFRNLSVIIQVIVLARIALLVMVVPVVEGVRIAEMVVKHHYVMTVMFLLVWYVSIVKIIKKEIVMLFKSLIFTCLLLSFTFIPAFADTHVNGYTRRDGTYVQPHMRSDRDGSFSNNWSSQGNVNPYTNERGYKQEPIHNNSYRLRGY